MSGKIFTIVILLIGAAILAGGLYYLVKEKNDKEAKKIYGIVSAVGAAVIIGTVIKMIVTGF